MKLASLLLALFAFGVGLWAARLWYQASKVTVVPLWAGGVEPGISEDSQRGWIAGLMVAGRKSGELNQRAAMWTAIAVLLTTGSALTSACAP
ncbi:hypothetical protein ACFOMD_12395 [Sphingoaurantiacus capsulatus]|uniref:Uncharacterized protein n=1 Tax=Sphingoaurantiacus capsulatus TaxID=1771310 RepID=A0ABV7XEK0_9SPHN